MECGALEEQTLRIRPARGPRKHMPFPDITLPHQGAIREEWLRARALVRYLHIKPGQHRV